MRFFIFIFLILISSFANSQTPIELDPCGNGPFPVTINANIALNKMVYQSSNYINGGMPSNCIDGIIGSNNYSRTSQEYRPWIEVDLGNPYYIKGIQLWYPESLYENGFQDYYIFTSEIPIRDYSMNDLITSSSVNHIYVQNQIPRGDEIKVCYQKARYIRIQLARYGHLTLEEIKVIGGGGFQGTEICNNGGDDDFDFKIDCDDPDCKPTIWWVNKKNPTCPICNDGFIEIKAYGQNLKYSIDDGLTYKDCEKVNQEGWCGFKGLNDGDYKIKVKSGDCITTWSSNPVLLRSPIGTPNGCCNNGDFESGNFENWTGGNFGWRRDPQTEIYYLLMNDPNNPRISNAGFISDPNPNDPYDDGIHTIITSGYKDPVVPNLSVPSGGTGTYLVRLGGPTGLYDYSKLSYCFVVEECNKNFSFNYLLVLQDPEGGHTEEERPFFQYVLTDVTTSETVKDFTRVANTQDNYFFKYDLPNTNDDISYTNWKCELIDLSSRIGHNMCITFVTSDCKRGDHYGYAYIDGLCNSPEDMKPKPVLDQFKDSYCKNETLVIDGSKSSGYNQFGWKICELQGSQEINCVEKPLGPYGNIGSLNLKSLYEQNGNFQFTCGKKYRVSLTLDNDCSDAVTVTKDVSLFCDEGVKLSYQDILNCRGGQIDLQILGTIEGCNNCKIDWTPAQYLDNPNIQNPTIKGTLNVNALKQTYHIVAKNDLGCITEDDIFINNLHLGNFVADVERTFCTSALRAIFSTKFQTPRGTVSVKFRNKLNGDLLDGVIQGTELNAEKWIFLSNSFNSNAFPSGDWEAIFQFSSTLQTNCEERVIDIGKVNSTNRYWGSFATPTTDVVIPNAFTPGGNNPTFGITISGCAVNNDSIRTEIYACKYLHNAYRMKMQIFDRWGAKVFEKEIFGTPTQPFNQYDCRWDGKVNGEDGLPDVYTYVIELENCTRNDGTTCGSNCSPPYVAGACTCNIWTGGVTLIR